MANEAALGPDGGAQPGTEVTYVKLPAAAMQRVIDYLIRRPWGEVASMMAEMQSTTRVVVPEAAVPPPDSTPATPPVP